LRDRLPKPYPAKRGIPNWYKKMPMTAFSEDMGKDVQTLKQCPPLLDAMSYGFIIPLPVDVKVDGLDFSWDWDIPNPSDEPGHSNIGLYNQSPVGFHTPAQATGTPYFKEGVGFAKFHCFWTIELESGYSLYVTHPANRYDLPFRTINGLVDADNFNKIFVNFPVLWVDENFKGVLPKGTPIAQCIAVNRQEHVLEYEDIDEDHAAQFMPLSRELAQGENVYKNKYRVKKP
jgi:hypothetical protein